MSLGLQHALDVVEVLVLYVAVEQPGTVCTDTVWLSFDRLPVTGCPGFIGLRYNVANNLWYSTRVW
jgi:hypothetical protein